MVEVAGRLVSEDHLRAADECPRAATRCCWPPDISAGRCVRRSPSPRRSTTWSSHSASGLRPAIAIGSVMFSAAVKVGTRLNDWKTKPIRSLRALVSSASFERGQLEVAEEHLSRGHLVEPCEAVQKSGLARA